MDKLPMHTLSLVDEKYAALAELFPNAVTEAMDEDGAVTRAIDADVLAQEINSHVVSGREERYQFTWPDKKKAVLLSNSPIAATLRPCREESVDFDNTENLYIEGDNLDVLKLLRETYLNRVKLIYIDPPYNTGEDFVYEDDFVEDSREFLTRDRQYGEDGNRMVSNFDSKGRFHTDWLNMIYPRLRVARDLLSDDGVMFISIDDTEIAQLRKLCDEIFGASNFVDTVIWEKRYSPQNAVQWFSETHDFIVVYAKNKKRWIPNLLERTEEMDARYRNLDDDPRGAWKATDSTAQAGHGTTSQFYVLHAPNGKKHELPSGRCWVYTEPVMNKMISDNRVWFGLDGNNVPAIKRFLSDVKQGTACKTIWNYEEVGHSQEGKKEIKDVFDSVPFDTPKPTRLINRILKLATQKDSIILDFFSGSATTGHAVIQLNAEDGGNRQFIMIQLQENCDDNSMAFKTGYKNICEIGKERIRRAGAKIKADSPQATQTLDIGFRVLKLDSSNMEDVYYTPKDALTEAYKRDGRFGSFIDNIKPDRRPGDLLFQVMLDLGIPLSAKIKKMEIGSVIAFTVADNHLIACFDRVTDEIITQIAQSKPHYVVFRDSSFPNDATLVNFDQIFNTYSPDTIRKVL